MVNHRKRHECIRLEDIGTDCQNCQLLSYSRPTSIESPFIMVLFFVLVILQFYNSPLRKCTFSDLKTLQLYFPRVLHTSSTGIPALSFPKAMTVKICW